MIFEPQDNYTNDFIIQNLSSVMINPITAIAMLQLAKLGISEKSKKRQS